MFDAIYPQNLPAGGDAYLGYPDGSWPDFDAIKARFPNVPVYALTVFGTTGVGDGVDAEPGDATVQQAAQYIADAESAGHIDRPIGYCPESWAAELEAEVSSRGVPRTAWRLLTAHYGLGEHICGPTTCGCPVQADGTQWLNAGTYDQSLVNADFITAASHPGEIVTPADIANIAAAVNAAIEPNIKEVIAGLQEINARLLADYMELQKQLGSLPASFPKAEPVNLKGETATITFN